MLVIEPRTALMNMDELLLDSEHIAGRVREMMERHNIGKRKQSSELCRILGLTFTHARRKITGRSPWALAQIKKVAIHFEESPRALIDTFAGTETTPTKGVAHDATLVIGSKEIPCLAWIGSEFIGNKPPEFLATMQNNTWRIYEAGVAPATAPTYSVELIEIRPRQSEADKPTIAVVDDEHDSADGICDYFNERGFKATPFYSTVDFLKALRKNPFDGYVIDWLVGRETSEKAIEEIRASENPDAPIILLTGELQTGKADETDIARVIRKSNVDCLEKPARLFLLAANLSKKLALS